MVRPDPWPEEARIAGVWPAWAEPLLGEYQHGILSVVPGDPVSRGEPLDRVRQWMLPRLRQGVVLLADGLEIAYRQLREGEGPDRAALNVDASIRDFVEREVPRLSGEGCRFQVTRASFLLEHEGCRSFRDALAEAVFGTSSSGQSLVDAAAAWVQVHRPPSEGQLSTGLLNQLALQALVDHLAVVGFLGSEGWRLHVHQGHSPALRWLNGDHPLDLPASTRRTVFVELGPRIWP